MPDPTQEGAPPEPRIHPAARPAPHRLGLLVVSAVGVVYGDIGTSPLYTLREAFGETGGLEPSQASVLGILSLVFWSLLVIVTLKYVVVIMRADNHGEGGILALAALALKVVRPDDRRQRLVVGLAMLGAALFFGDALITPAISVLSAVEGLHVATPVLSPYVVPTALAILVGLFLVQYRGTGRVGALFGPVMCLWFLTLAGLGTAQIIQEPGVLAAFSPLYAIWLFGTHPGASFVALGAVFLAVTGAEALYADMGHLGRRPIRLAWSAFVLPSLLLNYFGQGALLIRDPSAVVNPFYHLAPNWALYPMVALATSATVIASQAVISGAFSLGHQAVQLGYLPRLRVVHTSAREAGQIYLPRINWALLAGVVLLVLTFQSSSELAAAYGIAVSGTMVTTTIFAAIVARGIWGWRTDVVVLVFGALLAIELAFLGANSLKLMSGGWFPLLFAAVVFSLMSTWRKGREALFDRLYRDLPPLTWFVRNLPGRRVTRVPGTAVFPTGNPEVVPRALLHNLKHNKVLHERIIVLKIVVEEVPRVSADARLRVEDLGHDVHRVVARFGFLEKVDVPATLAACRLRGPAFDIMETSFLLSRETVLPSVRPELSAWRERIFIVLANTADDATSFFRIPPDRVVEIGSRIEL
jgi:KUP system potassium uptake protein